MFIAGATVTAAVLPGPVTGLQTVTFLLTLLSMIFSFSIVKLTSGELLLCIL